MKKETEGMKPLEARHPAEIEAEQLRAELAEERIKTDALSRHCIKLRRALDDARTDLNRIADAGVIGIVNGRQERLQAEKDNEKRRKIREEKALAEFDKACRRNAVSLIVNASIGFAAFILGCVDFIPTLASCIVTGISLFVFGWLMNNCIRLFGRCAK